VPTEHAEEWKPVMESLMLKAAATVLKDLPMKVDCKISDHWTK
jgi:DNA polymerase I-like protein with 3'-5' exonuclease and polymerase domains